MRQTVCAVLDAHGLTRHAKHPAEYDQEKW